jgi:hypothetical protein
MTIANLNDLIEEHVGRCWIDYCDDHDVENAIDKLNEIKAVEYNDEDEFVADFKNLAGNSLSEDELMDALQLDDAKLEAMLTLTELCSLIEKVLTYLYDELGIEKPFKDVILEPRYVIAQYLYVYVFGKSDVELADMILPLLHIAKEDEDIDNITQSFQEVVVIVNFDEETVIEI